MESGKAWGPANLLKIYGLGFRVPTQVQAVPWLVWMLHSCFPLRAAAASRRVYVIVFWGVGSYMIRPEQKSERPLVEVLERAGRAKCVAV